MKRLFFFGLLALSACKDEPEQIPAYLRIEPFTVNAEGAAGWQEITEGWLYVNGEFLGAYTLPATVPVLAEGDAELFIFPGIKENGISSTPNIYPFLTRSIQTKKLVPAETTPVQPGTAYDPATVFAWALNRCSFDGGSSITLENRDGDAVTGYEITADGGFSGNSIRMVVDTAHNLMDVATEAVSLPGTYENPVWLELHYASDMPFSLFLLGQSGSLGEVNQVVYGFNSTGGAWNKIYLNLTDFLISMNQEKYRLLFDTSLPRDAQGNFSQNTGNVRLDNIRLLHF